MGATEEQMQFLSDAGVTHVSYILLLYSITFLLFLFVNMLLHLYAVHAWPDDETNGRKEARLHSRNASVALGSQRPGILKRYSDAESPTTNGVHGGANGKVKMPRHRPTDSQQVRDAEEFELEGLITDGEDDEGIADLKQKNRFNKSTEAV
jgi:hypothetical protein